MRSIFTILLLVLFGNLALAKQHSAHQHAAHVHGSAKLDIAFDGLKGKIEFKAAAMGMLGFEHPAKSKKDKEKLNKVTSVFEANIAKLVAFDPTKDCSISKEKIELMPDEDGDHADFVANFKVTCLKDILGSALTVDFSEYKGLKDVDVTVLVGVLQKSAEAKGQAVKIELN